MASSSVTNTLLVPSDFNDKPLTDANVLEWNSTAQAELRQLAKTPGPLPNDLALLASVAALDGQDAFPDSWLAPETQRLASRKNFLLSSVAHLLDPSKCDKCS